MERIDLLGSEDVKKAGHEMTQAADTMSHAANLIFDAVQRLEQLWSEIEARPDRSN